MALSKSEIMRRFRLRHPEKMKQWKRAWYLRNRERISRERKENPEKRRAYQQLPASKARSIAASRSWRERHPDYIGAYSKANRAKLQEQENKRRALKRKPKPTPVEKTREEINAHRREMYQKNIAKHRATDRKRYWANPEKRRTEIKAYRKAHPEVFAEAQQRRLARIRNAGRVDKISLKRLIARDRDICHLCGLKIKKGERSVDHLIPIKHGGTHTEDNVALAHILCNSRRGAGRIAAQLRLFG